MTSMEGIAAHVRAFSRSIQGPMTIAPHPFGPATASISSDMPVRPKPASPPRPAFEASGKHVYLIGIGGSGMSGLAQMLAGRGAMVSGSDREETDATLALKRQGISIGFEQARQWLPEACDLVIASAAIRADHPQMLAANDRAIPTMLYAEALGLCMSGRTGVCVAGTHGKSTTTAMLGCALADAGLDPTVIVGATSNQLSLGCKGAVGEPTGFRLGAAGIPAGALAGTPGLLIAESCEFNRSFHNLRPTIASISSVEADHLDVYGTLEAVIEAFHEFAALIPARSDGGKLLIAHDNAHRRQVTAGIDCLVETIGFSPQADWQVEYEPVSRRVTLSRGQIIQAVWMMRLPGAHNAMNAATALVLATWAGADPFRVAESLAAFAGIDRRMQMLGDKPVGGGTVRVYDDYGHHPTEIDVTLRALREAEQPQTRQGRLICVFQPHQHSRTRHLMEEFASSFSQADVVIVPDIYFVRDSEAEKQKVTAGDLVDRLRQKGVRAMHLYPFQAIIEQLENMCRPGDVLVCMGAGPVWRIAKGYLGQG